jgi:2,4-dienoyl-CoA reductase-like NADH-dependent reductase (Old Yellow Enzyme family)
MSILFSPLKLRSLTLPNRVVVSPMCQYSAEEGFANDWHLVHLGSRAIGGAGTVMVEATAVEARGRISPADLGIWTDQHIEPLVRIARFLKQHGSVPAIQLAHAGRKAATSEPWLGGRPLLEAEPKGAAARHQSGEKLANRLGGALDSAPVLGELLKKSWQPVAPSPIPFDQGYAVPTELTTADIQQITNAFVAAAGRAHEAGFEIIELHAAHGYLLNQFLSPLSNHRTDEYGGSFENRIRFPLEVIRAVRAVWPECFPLFLRVSSTDWAPGGWTIDDSVRFAKLVQPLGVELIDCSSGGLVPRVQIPVAAGYQVGFADQIHRESGILTGAVGMISDPAQAEAVLQADSAALIIIAREFLREPYWPIKAAKALGVDPVIPVQYQRAFSR